MAKSHPASNRGSTPNDSGSNFSSRPAGERYDSLTDGSHKVDAVEAIRERLQLYPKAMTYEIVAMLELDGIHVTPEEVEQVKASGGW